MKRRGLDEETNLASCEVDDSANTCMDYETKPLIAASQKLVAIEDPYVGWIARTIGYGDLVKNFGTNLLLILFASQHLTKGFAMSMTGAGTQYLYASYGIVGPHMQIFSGVAQIPWAMKPVIGLISDAFPIFGYNKAPYIFGSTVLGILASAAVGFIPQRSLNASVLTLFLFLMQLQFSTTDLLVEAKYAEKMQAKPEKGPDLMSFVWLGLNFGSLIAIISVGHIISVYGPKLPFILAIPAVAFIVVPLSRNALEETAKTREQIAYMRERLLQQREACCLALLMFVSTIALSVIGLKYESAKLNASVSIAVAIIILIAFSVVLNPVIAKVNAFFLIQTSMAFSISGGSFYFYTDSPTAYPEGPHFSQEFFVSVLGVASVVCAIVGIWSYQRFASKWSYRRLLLVSNVVMTLFSIPDIIVFKRLNLRLGIPDHYCVLGTSILCSVIGQWMWMPGVVILSQLCPKGMEATMYALLAGCHNLGGNIASNSGALVLELFGVKPSGAPGESAAFEHLWVCALVSMMMPMVTMFLLPWLIPDALQTEKLLESGEKSAVKGSLWQRWTAQ